MAAQLVDAIKAFEAELKDFRKAIKAEPVNQIGKQSLRQRAEKLGTAWFSEIAPQLQTTPVLDDKTNGEYSQRFEKPNYAFGPEQFEKQVS